MAQPTRPGATRQPPKPQGQRPKPAAAGAKPAAAARPAARPAPARPTPQQSRPAAGTARPAPASQQARPAVVRRDPTPQQRPNPRAQQERLRGVQEQLGDQTSVGMDEREQHEAQATNGQAHRQAETGRAVAPRPSGPRSAPRPQQAVSAQPRGQAIRPATSRAIVGATAGVKLAQLPDFMRDDIGRGTENIQAEDLGIVQIKLMQALSPELEVNDDLRPGDFWHSGAGVNLGPSFAGIVVHFQKQFILWRPREMGGGILARALDGKHWAPANMEFAVTLDKKDGGHAVTWRTASTVEASGLGLWGSQNPDDPQSPPAATQMYSLLTIPYENPDLGPAIVTFQRSSLKRGKQLLSRFKTVQGPLFGTIYEFSSFEDTNSVGQRFHNFRAEAHGFIEDQVFFEQMKHLNAGFAQKGFDIRDIESMQDEPIDTEAYEDPNVQDAETVGDEAPAY